MEMDITIYFCAKPTKHNSTDSNDQNQNLYIMTGVSSKKFHELYL